MCRGVPTTFLSIILLWTGEVPSIWTFKHSRILAYMGLPLVSDLLIAVGGLIVEAIHRLQLHDIFGDIFFPIFPIILCCKIARLVARWAMSMLRAKASNGNAVVKHDILM